MNEFLDANGAELLYWPVGAIRSGADSAPLTIQVKCGPERLLTCEVNPNGTVFGRQGTDPYQDLAANPIDLTPFGIGYHSFQIYLHATVGLTGSIRLPLTLGFATHSPANWGG
jgi:hypothetical protein